MSLSRFAAMVDAIRTESGALGLRGASARATELDMGDLRDLGFRLNGC
jgi:hypothetical protein